MYIDKIEIGIQAKFRTFSRIGDYILSKALQRIQSHYNARLGLRGSHERHCSESAQTLTSVSLRFMRSLCHSEQQIPSPFYAIESTRMPIETKVPIISLLAAK